MSKSDPEAAIVVSRIKRRAAEFSPNPRFLFGAGGRIKPISESGIIPALSPRIRQQ
jgi:hypothetical protein